MPTVLNLIFLRRLRADCLELDFFDGGFVPTVLNLFFLRRLRADCLELDFLTAASRRLFWT